MTVPEEFAAETARLRARIAELEATLRYATQQRCDAGCTEARPCWRCDAAAVLAKGREAELATLLKRELRKVRGVDAAYREPGSDEAFVAVLDHTLVDRFGLLEVEEVVYRELGMKVDVRVRAHQGRDPDRMFPNTKAFPTCFERLF